ncbi:MAG: TonB-dependent receptor, partial [bacterium]|nr:TonB-dependent receptor [bacterium]
IAPANHGDYIGGIINVKTKTSVKPTHRLKGKNNPDTKELNFGGSFPLGQTGVNYNLNWAHSEEDIRKDYDNTQRLAAQLSFKNKFFNEKMDVTNQLKYSTLFEEIRVNKDDPDAMESINKGYRFIYGNQFDYQIDPISTIKSNLYINYRRVDSYKQTRRISDNRVTSTLLEEGTTIGIKQYGPYIYQYTTIGDEVTIGHELDWSRHFYTGSYFHEIKIGNEFQYDDNFGKGKTFDLLKPSSPGDRPRSFDDVPGTLQHSIYLNDQITGRIWKEFSLNLGFRLERYNTARYNEIQFFKSKNGAFLNPRINFAYFLGKDSQLRIGYGKSSKSPSLNSIYSEPFYLDVQDIVPIYQGSDTLLVRDSLVTTYIYETANPNLKGYQEEKIELSLDHRIGDIGLSLTGFYSQRDQEPFSQDQPFLYFKYFRPNWPNAEGEAIAETYLDVYKKSVNGGWTNFDGAEFTLKTRQVKKLNMDFMFNATYHHVKSGAEGLSWGSVRSDYIIPIYQRGRNWTQKLLLTYQVNYISKPLGIWISLTAQQRAHYQTKSLGFSDSLAVAYYDGATDQVVQIPESERLDAAYKNYRLTKNPIDYKALDYPSKWIFNVRVSKSLFKGAEVSLFVNNFLDDRAVFEDPRLPGYYRTANPEIFYGIEFSMLMDNLLYRRSEK